MLQVLHNVSEYEGIELPPAFGQKIASSADGNMRKALLMLEAAKVQQ
jgi:replication factor C subunit 3/5